MSAASAGATEVVRAPRLDLSGRQLAIVTISLLLSQVLSAFDSSIVSTALPSIVSELAGLDLYAWVTTANLVTMTAVVPISGKLGDRYGRKLLIQIGVTGFVIVSILAGLSSSMPQLLAARAVQGVFIGLVTSSTIASLADLYSPATRARMQGLFTSFFAVASVTGPIIGGLLTDHLGWRSVFFFNVPLGIVALLVVAVTMPRVQREHVAAKLDTRGAVLLVAGLVPLLTSVSATRSGGIPPSAMFALFAIALVLLAAWVHTEMRAPDPVVPFTMFRDPTVAVAILAATCAAFALMGSSIFVPLLYQGLLGASATQSGLYQGPRVIALVIGSLICGQIVTRTDRYRFVGVVGFAVLAIGLFLLSRTTATSSAGDVVIALVLTGGGFGMTQPIYQNVVMSAVAHRYVGVASSQAQFARALGQTIGVAAMGIVLAAQVTTTLGPVSVDPAPAVALGPLEHGLRDVFFLAALVAGAGAVVGLFLKEVPMRAKGRRREPDAPPDLAMIAD